MNRRQFFMTAPGLALAPARSYAAEFADDMPLRVGLIGCGWYGKSDLPAEPDHTDRDCLAVRCRWTGPGNGGAMVGAEAAFEKRPRLYKDYRELLKAGASTWLRSRLQTTGMRCR